MPQSGTDVSNAQGYYNVIILQTHSQPTLDFSENTMPPPLLHSLTQPVPLSISIIGLALPIIYLLRRPSTAPAKSIPSPLTTLLPGLSDTEGSAVPYPPDLFPGARDVESPYGTLRVYEWGPGEGRKVLLLHGVSTPCLSLGRLAEGLTARGTRCMLIGE